MLLLAMTALAYSPVWHAGYVWDDDDHFTANVKMTEPGGLGHVWTEQEHYYPLTLTSWWLMRRLWGLTPLPYHLVNVLLHAVNAMLLWRLLQRMRIPGAWLAAGVFALHPVHVQSVAWATELKNCQSGFFFLLALLAWARSSETQGSERRWYGWSFFFFALAVASKTSTVVLAPILPLIDLRLGRRLDSRTALRWLPFWALVAVAAFMTTQRQAAMSTGPEWSQNLIERTLLASRAFWFYLGKLVYPSSLAFVYPRWTASPARALDWAPLGALLLLTAGLVTKSRAGDRRYTAALHALAYFAIALGPVLGFFKVYYQRYSWVADHWQYLASMGAIAWIVGSAAGVARNRLPPRARGRLGSTLACVLLLILGALTWRQSRVYRNDETLWRDVIAKNPSCVLARNNLGLVYLQTNRIPAAMECFEEGLQWHPEDAELHHNLAVSLARMKRPIEALSHYQEALRLKPDLADAENNLGKLLQSLGRVNEAIAHYSRAVRLNPGEAEFENDLGASLAVAHRYEEARAHLQAALAIKSDFADAHVALGSVLAALGRDREALPHLETALRLKPNDADAAYNLASLLAKMGRFEDAIERYQEALRLQPDSPDTLNGLAVALLQIGESPRAIDLLEKALQLDPDNPETHYNYAVALASMGRLDAAIVHFKETIRHKPDDTEARRLLDVARRQARGLR